MPNYFTLTRKSEPAAGPISLSLIDEEICAALGEPVDPQYYCRGWYNIIGLYLACGRSFDFIRENLSEEGGLIPVLDYIAANFTTNAWYQSK